MFGYEKINLNLSFNSIYFILGLILLAAYSFYVYRFTLPPVSNPKKYILTFLRSFSLVLLLFIFFEPVLTLTNKLIIIPTNVFYLDNSRSIKFDDTTNRPLKFKAVIEALINSNLNESNEYYSFGSSIKLLETDSLSKLNWSDATTDFSSIFKNLQQSEKNIASVTIISDGVITEGSTPIYAAEKSGIPVFTVGIGDSTKKNDIEIKNIINNEFIYAGNPTTILATVLNKGYSGKTSQISLYENSNLIEQKNIIFDRSGVNSISFNYTPKQSGEQKLSIKVSNLDGEANYLNNQKVIFINVLSNKINILLISGSPSPDLTFIKNSLTNDENLKVSSLTQIVAGNFLEENSQAKLDSANIIYLLGYPTASSSEEFFNKLVNKLENKSIPIFILINGEISINKLERLKNFLPFTTQRIENNYLQVQPDVQISELKNPTIESNSFPEWSNLPPISQPLALITVKPESKIISKIRVDNSPRNIPLMISRNFGSKRSIAFIGKDIWKWKLQTTNKNLNLFDNFILNSTRWLNAPDDQKKVKIKTSKKIYSSGEIVEFSAQVYDESFNPVNDAEVKVNMLNKDYKTELNLNSVGNGLYEGSISLDKNGDYLFTGNARIDDKLLGTDKGNFDIGDVNIEMLDTRMNYEFLNLLSDQTKGKYFSPENIKGLIARLNEINLNSSKEKLKTSEIRLWSDEWLLVIVILLFALEWFIRKREGML